MFQPGKQSADVESGGERPQEKRGFTLKLKVFGIFNKEKLQEFSPKGLFRFRLQPSDGPRPIRNSERLCPLYQNFVPKATSRYVRFSAAAERRGAASGRSTEGSFWERSDVRGGPGGGSPPQGVPSGTHGTCNAC